MTRGRFAIKILPKSDLIPYDFFLRSCYGPRFPCPKIHPNEEIFLLRTIQLKALILSPSHSGVLKVVLPVETLLLDEYPKDHECFLVFLPRSARRKSLSTVALLTGLCSSPHLKRALSFSSELFLFPLSLQRILSFPSMVFFSFVSRPSLRTLCHYLTLGNPNIRQRVPIQARKDFQ